jgi:hypothetical protein
MHVKRWAVVAGLALQAALPARAGADQATPAVSAAPPPPVSPKRPVPDYDGRGSAPVRPEAVALWVPRVVLSPVYFVTEYVLRLPLSIAVPAAENADLPRKIYDFFTFGPDHKAGFAPIGLVEFNFNPSVGVYAFWDDAGFKGDDLRAHVEVWPDDWLYGSLAQRILLADNRTLQLRVSGLTRPDKVFYGLGPSSLEASQSRYAIQRVDGGAAYEWRFWRSSRIETAVGVRDVSTKDGHFNGNPTLTQEAATGAFTIPYGFGREYTAETNDVVAALDSRPLASAPSSGARLELAAEQGNDVRSAPASGWIRYSATAGGYLDLTGHGRVLGLSATTLFVDPLGSEPVPFTELVYLGGDHAMMGYYDGRLRDRSAAAATATYSWPIAAWLDGDIQLEVGNVFGAHLDGFDARLLRFSGALGLTFAASRNNPFQDAPAQLLVGVGSETFEHGGQIDSLRVMLGVPQTL